MSSSVGATNSSSLRPWPTTTAQEAAAVNPPNFRFTPPLKHGEPLGMELRMWRGEDYRAVPPDSLLYMVVACRSERGEKGTLPEYPIPVAAFRTALEKVLGCACRIEDHGCLYLHPGIEVRETTNNTIIAPTDMRYQAALKTIVMQPTTSDRIVNAAVRVGAAALVMEPTSTVIAAIIGGGLFANRGTRQWAQRTVKGAAEIGLGGVTEGFRMANLARVNALIERSWKLPPPPESTETSESNPPPPSS
jgi:hypothetical protein